MTLITGPGKMARSLPLRSLYRYHRNQSSPPRRGGRNQLTKLPVAKTSELVPLQASQVHPVPIRLPYPREIAEYLDRFVIGQRSAKKTLSVGVYQHYKRLMYNQELAHQAELVLLNSVKIEQNERRRATREISKGKRKSSLNQTHYEDFIAQEILRQHEAKMNEGIGSKFNAKIAQEDAVALDITSALLEKSNIVLVGPSGVGKTYLTQKLAAILDVPIALCDCTTLTQAGYVGEDAETVIQKLLQNADGDVERAQQGIVFLDEFDKIATSSDPIHSTGFRDVGGRGVQQALLKIVEGTVCKVKHPYSQGTKVDVDTSNILFVASGAFNNLDRVVGRRLNQRSVGFAAALNTNHDEDLKALDELTVSRKRDELLAQADQSDLITFGMVPELVGRFPVLVSFHSLNEDMLVKVMREPQNSVLNQAEKLFGLDGIKLEFTDKALKSIAKEAVQRKTGARALRSIIERILLDAKFDCPGSDTAAVVICEKAVDGTGTYDAFTKNTKGEGTL
ncbi:hypothetical protein QR680_003794 [Steinernema hermaphroditum]|uniref:AAA+ ATPase domain-containing protein n=1 Tax=Steinernema hermaphroditum TaxID=289476 RepID=A0AA39LSW0_9BILA|nr:hypothetical protein QR680_003794 [Steinernema hermaphroditum]